MSFRDRPTSPEQHLEDTLYNFQALQEISLTDPEWAIIGEQIDPNCSVFEDQKSGNRIVISRLPLDPEDFSGANIQISNYEDPIIISWNDQIVVSNEINVQVSGELTPSMSYLYYDPQSNTFKNSTWFEGSADQLAFLLDMPQTKPYPKSKYDRRVAPPIIEREMPVRKTPGTLHKFYEGQLNDDLLHVPSDMLYTYLSGQFDEQNKDEQKYSNVITREGISTTHYNSYLIDVTEINPEESIAGLIDDVEDFDREFYIKYRSTSGPITIGTKPLGSDEFVPHTDREFEFTLKRNGMLQHLHRNNREYLSVPHQSAMFTIYHALSVGEQW